MKLNVEAKLFQMFPGLVLGVVVGNGINNSKTNSKIQQLLKEQQELRGKEFQGVELAQQERIKPWREAYSKFGSKPAKYNSSIESLLKRVIHGGNLPTINPVVDLYNALSLKYLLPFGAEDLGKVKGDIRLAVAKGTEPGVYIGGVEVETCEKGEVAYLDELGFICRRWNWREADRTKLTFETTDFILVIEALPPVGRKEVELAVEDFIHYGKELLGGTYNGVVLDEKKQVFEVNFQSGGEISKEDIKKLELEKPLVTQESRKEKSEVLKKVKKQYVGMSQEIYQALYRVTGLREIEIEHPAEEEYGDFASNIALAMFSNDQFLCFKDQFKNPRELAEKIVGELTRSGPVNVEKIEVAGPGFINFYLSKEALFSPLQEILKQKDKFGTNTFGKGKRIMYEFGQPNTHKAPHIGHLFSYILGESMIRILEANGNTLFRANYQGDIGLHVAKCLWAYQKKKPSIPKTLKEKVNLLQLMYQEGSAAFEEEEKTKEEILLINKSIYQQDATIADLWRKTRKWNVDYYKEFEKRLGVHYDRYYFESEVHKQGMQIVKDNVGKVFKKSEGAIIFKGSKYGLHDRVFVTKYDTPTYEAKDMYLQQLKMKEWPYDLLIITTAHEQNEYFKVIYKALEKLDRKYEGKLKHIGFGMVNLKGGKISSRTGNIVGAVDLVDITVEKIKTILRERGGLSVQEVNLIAEAVGIGAVKYAFLKIDPLKDRSFDLEETVSFVGNSGPYIQYTHARARSVLARAKLSKINFQFSKINVDLNYEEMAVLRWLYRFPEVVEQAGSEYAPHLVCTYLYELAQRFNTFYNKHSILGRKGEKVEKVPHSLASDSSHALRDDTTDIGKSTSRVNFRLGLTAVVAQVLKNGLNLLGIEAPEKM